MSAPGTEELRSVLASLVGRYDEDEPVDEYAHALQSAGLALAAGSRPALVAAALLHDVGRSPLVAGEGPGLTHESAGAAWLAPRLGEEVAFLVGAHVAAKLYLLRTDPGYASGLSPASVRSALRQGEAAEDRALERHELWADAVALRRFDDAAKRPDATLPDLDELLELIAPLLGGAAPG